MVRKFLLIDDDRDDRELFCEAIEALDEDIVCFAETNGRKVLEKLDSKIIEIPDVIFIDVNMPVLSGWQFLGIVKSKPEYKNIPAIMYSTSTEVEDISKARELGALCYLKKPPDFTSLKESLEVIINHVKGGGGAAAV
jgi:CheY-like chemotaxis protein